MLTAPIEHDPLPALVLASNSPRRAALLREFGYTFRILAPTIDEPDAHTWDVPPAHIAEALSFFKARSVVEAVGDGLIVAADTVAVVDGAVFGKPVDRADAQRILGQLVGTTHHVITGVTLLDAATARRDIRHATTAVTMRAVPKHEVEAYLDSGAWENKAGAYGIQDHGDRFVERVDGSFTNVVGLPMELLANMLADWGRAGRRMCERASGTAVADT